ncbi:MAG: LamG domain-containing protein, partial [bacterium]|nr:LamG domain-containing protein [bacterium]
EFMTCTASGVAVEGQYANLGSAEGTDPNDTVVTDEDPSHYLGVVPDAPAIDIEKATNGEDADDPTGPEILVGDAVAWTYVVTNIGNVDLIDVSVVDDQGVTVTCPQDTLVVDEFMTCTASGVAVEGQYANLGSAEGTDPNDTVVTDEDPSHYLGVVSTVPGIDIEKATNGEDADTPTGPEILVGDPVTWTYVVTNTGGVAFELDDVVVTDDQGLVPVLDSASDVGGDEILSPGEQWLFEASGFAVAGQYTNVGTVTGATPTGWQVSDSDPSNYFGVPAAGYGQTVLADGADVYWRLGELSGTTVVDELGGNDAVYGGSPTLGASSVIVSSDSAVDFDGVDDWIEISNSAEINQGGPYSAKTIELWFNADNVTNRQVLMEQGSVSRGFNIYLDGGKLYAGMYNTADNGGNTPWGPVWLSTGVSLGTDYHVVMVLDGAGDLLSLYVNGALADSGSGVGDLYNHSLSAIGAQRNWARYHTGAVQGDLNFFDGTLDEIAVYNSVLSSGTVAAHYAAGTANSTEPTISIESPTEGSSVTDTVTVVVNATDPDDPVGSLDVEVRTDGATWNTATWNGATSRYEYSWDTSLNGDGPATVEARVTDQTPTTVVATPRNVTVSTPPAAGYGQTVLADGADVYWRLGELSGTTVVDELGGNDAVY